MRIGNKPTKSLIRATMHAIVPITPFHFGPGAAIYAAAPRYVSFFAFCAANILMDVEPLYYMLTQQYPLHRFFHTYIGASIVAAATVGLTRIHSWEPSPFPRCIGRAWWPAAWERPSSWPGL
jgi:hypothetical protein